MTKVRFDNIDRTVVFALAVLFGALSVPAMHITMSADSFLRWSAG
jgi:hypothetical protein